MTKYYIFFFLYFGKKILLRFRWTVCTMWYIILLHTHTIMVQLMIYECRVADRYVLT